MNKPDSVNVKEYLKIEDTFTADGWNCKNGHTHVMVEEDGVVFEYSLDEDVYAVFSFEEWQAIVEYVSGRINHEI